MSRLININMNVENNDLYCETEGVATILTSLRHLVAKQRSCTRIEQ